MMNVYDRISWLMVVVGLTFSLTSFSQGQEDSKTLIWETETDFEYILETDRALSFDASTKWNGISSGTSSVEALKVDVTKSNVFSNKYLTETLLNLLFEKKLRAYSLANEKNLSVEEIKSLTSTVDTVITYDPENFKEKLQIVSNDLSNHINSLVIKQRWQFDESTRRMTSLVLGVIPVLHHEGEKLRLFWVPFPEVDGSGVVNVNAPENIWIKFSKDMVSFQGGVNKEDTQEFFEKEIWNGTRDNKHKIYDVKSDIFFSEELPTNYMKDNILTAIVDTVIIYDPETFEEETEIHYSEAIKFEDIVGYKIYQLWYFDLEKRSLNSKLLGIAPLLRIKNEQGDFEYYLPLFRIEFD